MAYLLRSMAVIGVIALNSPVHGGKSGEDGPASSVRNVVKAASRIDAGSAASGLTAAREAAQIMAGLDPETRRRVLDMAAAHLTGGHAASEAPPSPR